MSPCTMCRMFQTGCRSVGALVPAWLLAVSCLAMMSGQVQPSPQWTASVQTGVADTFQLTLGGMFGNGPAWQNRLTVGLVNAFHAGDTISLYGWDTFDTRSRSHNWQAGMAYKRPVWKRHYHMVSAGSGVQHWQFSSVKSGTNDWLIPGNLTYQTRIHGMSFLTTADSWTLLKSPLTRGSLLHTQSWLQTDLFKRESFGVAFRHGPAHTYSWNFYGTNGNRVFRYQTMLTIAVKRFLLEGGYRKQWGLQNGIQDNRFWQVGLTRTYTQRHP